jgi:hypothetical protein
MKLPLLFIALLVVASSSAQINGGEHPLRANSGTSSDTSSSLDTSSGTSADTSVLESHSMKHHGHHHHRPVSPMMANGGGYHSSRSRRSWQHSKMEGSHSGRTGGHKKDSHKGKRGHPLLHWETTSSSSRSSSSSADTPAVEAVELEFLMSDERCRT